MDMRTFLRTRKKSPSYRSCSWQSFMIRLPNRCERDDTFPALQERGTSLLQRQFQDKWGYWGWGLRLCHEAGAQVQFRIIRHHIPGRSIFYQGTQSGESKCMGNGNTRERSLMNTKCKTCDIRIWEKTFISLYILHQLRYTCPIALPACQNPQHWSLLAAVSATSAPPFHPLHQKNVCHPVVNRFTSQTLPTINRKHFFMHIFPC
jgi:hypothetical protein